MRHLDLHNPTLGGHSNVLFRLVLMRPYDMLRSTGYLGVNKCSISYTYKSFTTMLNLPAHETMLTYLYIYLVVPYRKYRPMASIGQASVITVVPNAPRIAAAGTYRSPPLSAPASSQ